MEVSRLSMRTTDESGIVKYVPTPSVKIYFPGKVLPNYVEVEKLLIPLRPFSKKAMFCDRCLRFNHTSKFCSSKPVCAKCSEMHLTTACTNQDVNSLDCPFCNTEHPTKSACAFFTEVNNSYKAAQEYRRKQIYQESVAIISKSTQLPTLETTIDNYKTTFPSLKRSRTSLSDPKAGTSTEIVLTNSFEGLSDTARESEKMTQPKVRTSGPQKLLLKNPWARTKSSCSRRSRSRSVRNKKTEIVQQNYSKTQNKVPIASPPGFRKLDSKVGIIIESVCRKFQLSESTTQLIQLIFPYIASFFPKITSMLELLSPLITHNG